MKLVFMCPHTSVSGGVKVIFRFAHALRKQGVDAVIAVRRITDANMPWLIDGAAQQTPFAQASSPTHPWLASAACIVNFADGRIFPELHNKKQILLLQGFGTQHMPTEERNLKFPYTAVIATSKWLADVALKYGHKDITIIHPGIDGIFSPSLVTRDPHTILVGGLFHKSPMKNFNRFVEAVILLKETYNINVVPIMISSTNINSIGEFSKRGIKYQIYTNPQQLTIPTIYAMCTVWLSTSLSEGWGLPTLESLACGTPVVYIPSMGLDEYMRDGKTCLISKDNSNDVAAAAHRIISDVVLHKTLSENGRALVKTFSWANATKRFLEELNRILK